MRRITALLPLLLMARAAIIALSQGGAPVPAPYSITPSHDAREIVWLLDSATVSDRDRDLVLELMRRTAQRASSETGFSFQTVGGSERVGLTRSVDRMMRAAAAVTYGGSHACRVDHVAGSLASILAPWGDSRGSIVVVAAASEMARTRLGSPCGLTPRISASLQRLAVPGAKISVVQLPDPGGSTRAYALRQLADAASARHWTLTTAVEMDAAVDRVLADSASDHQETAARALPELLFRYGFATDLKLKATEYVSADREGAASRVIIAFESVGGARHLSAAVAGLMDPGGVPRARWTASEADLGSTPVLAAFTAPPGDYRVRVCAADGARVGCVDHEFDLPLMGAAALSSLVLGVRQADRVIPRLDFTVEKTAAVYAELSAPNVQSAEYLLQLTDTAGASIDLPVRASAVGRHDNRKIESEIPLSELASGDYHVSLRVKLSSGQSLIRTRILRKGS